MGISCGLMTERLKTKDGRRGLSNRRCFERENVGQLELQEQCLVELAAEAHRKFNASGTNEDRWRVCAQRGPNPRVEKQFARIEAKLH